MAKTQSMNENEPRFSRLLDGLKEKLNSDVEKPITIGELVKEFGPRGHAFLIFLLVLPFMQPIPIPGVSSILGLSVTCLAYLMIVDKPPRLPERFARVELKRDFLRRVTTGVSWILKKIEKFTKPRGRALFRGHTLSRISGVLLIVFSVLLSLPLPIPFSNFVPAVVLILLAVGHLEEDFVMIAAGWVASVVCAAFFVALVAIPYFAAKSWT